MNDANYKAAYAKLKDLHYKGYLVGLADPALGGPQPRDDIDELANDHPKTFHLFVQAFKILRDRDPSDPHSFYQIAAIHGLPAGPWNGIKPPWVEEGSLVGFCTHGDSLFPVWHRPYLVLLEQTLFIEVNELALKFNDSSYFQAAKEFRLPYWDYFRPRGRDSLFPTIRDEEDKPHFDYDFSVPTVLTVEKLMVRTPEQPHELTPVDNPLRWAPFPTAGDAAIQEKNWNDALGIEGPHYSKSRTNRHPTKDLPEGDTARLNRVVNMRREDNLRYVITLVTSYLYGGNYDSFATDAQGPMGLYDEITQGSIESYHNDYHVLLGGLGGHMASVPLAAHDPIFWMHHGMVERVFAIWQLINPDTWFKKPTIPGKPSKETKALVPFKAPRGGSVDGFWTAKGARYTTDLGYYYRHFDRDNRIQNSDVKAAKQRGETARSNFIKWYEWGRRLYVENYGKNPWPIYDLSKSDFFNYGDLAGADQYLAQLPVINAPEPQLEKWNEGGAFSREWYIDNKVSRLALNGAFTIFWFIDEDHVRINNTPAEDFILLPTMAGLTHIFAAPVQICDNCAKQDEQALVVRSTAPISASLLDYVEIKRLGSLDPEDVIPFLVKNLTWRIVKVDGTVIEPEDVENFAVNVTVKASPLPLDGKKEPIYLSYPQVARGIANRERLNALERKQSEEIAALRQRLDEETNWSLLGEQRPHDSHESEHTILSNPANQTTTKESTKNTAAPTGVPKQVPGKVSEPAAASSTPAAATQPAAQPPQPPNIGQPVTGWPSMPWAPSAPAPGQPTGSVFPTWQPPQFR